MWKRLCLLPLLLWLLVIPCPVKAAESADVGITATPLLVGGILNFVITYVNDTQLDLSWGYEEGTTAIMIRGKYGSYPDDIPDEDTEPSDGYLVYSGNATSVSDTSMNFDQNPGPLYYAAWGRNEAGKWQTTASTGEKESAVVTLLGFAFLVLALTIYALVKRNAALCIVSVIGWLTVAFYFANATYPPGNDYIPYAITGFCLSMAIVMVVQVIQVYTSGRPKAPTSSEVQAEHKKKVLGLTKQRKPPWWME